MAADSEVHRHHQGGGSAVSDYDTSYDKATFGNRRNWSRFMALVYEYERWFAGVRS